MRWNKNVANAIAVVLLTAACGRNIAQANPLGEVGRTATFQLGTTDQERPEFERTNKLTVVEATIQLGSVEKHEGNTYQWCRLSFVRKNGQRYALSLLLDEWPVEGKDPRVARYIWQEPQWEMPLEYVNETSGEAMLPRWSLWKYGWPQAISGGPLGHIDDEMYFQGHRFKRSDDTTAEFRPPKDVQTVRLNPDLVIGSIYHLTDVLGVPLAACPCEEYQYDSRAAEAMRLDVASGMNRFEEGPAGTIPWMWQEGVYYSTHAVEDWPALLYRSNFWGRAWHVDEPAIWYQADLNQRPTLIANLTPQAAGEELEARVKGRVESATHPSSVRWVNQLIDEKFSRGNIEIEERDFPVWEALWETAWYQMEPVGGIVDEDSQNSLLVERYNMALGSQIPPSIENAAAIRVAVLRGAARNFGKRWGISIYATNEPDAKLATLEYFYNKGANYLWFWNGWPGMNSHVPYPYQRYYAAAMRSAYARNPNRDMPKLLKAAKAAIVLPSGYVFSYTPMYNIHQLHLDRLNEHGKTYRQVLAAAAIEAERYIRSGVEFDLAIDEPRFHPSGYEELAYVNEDATVRIVRGSGETSPTDSRLPARPILGPEPRLSVEAKRSGDKVEARAHAEPGTGELVRGNDGKPLVVWEFYQPEARAVSSEGETASFGADPTLAYRLRCAIIDVFGRPVSVEIAVPQE